MTYAPRNDSQALSVSATTGIKSWLPQHMLGEGHPYQALQGAVRVTVRRGWGTLGPLAADDQG